MPRPADLPPAQRLEHGTRSRYVAVCRCDECRASNTRYYHERQARAKSAALALGQAPMAPAPQLWTAPDGTRKVRLYGRACPGVEGKPCELRAHLRRDSKGGVCRHCRGKLVWNGLIPADRVKAHLEALSAAGVGYKSVAAACDVAASTLAEIRAGRRTQLRKRTEARILAVDAGAVADHALVPAAGVRQLVGQLLELGYTKTAIAAALGSRARTPALQLGGERVLAKTVRRVRRIHMEMARALMQRLEVRDELAAVGELGREYFAADGYSVIRRGKSTMGGAP